MQSTLRVTACALFAAALCGLCGNSVRAQSAFSSAASVNFEIRYLRGIPEGEAQKVTEFLDEEFKAILGQVGLQPKKKIEVRIYDNVGRYLAEAGLKKPWRGAVYARGILHCQPPAALEMRGIFETSLRYELARAMVETSGERGCPLWLRESYAVYYAGAYREFTPPLGAKLSAFSDLNQDIQTYTEPPQRDDVHYMLGHTMNFFIQKFGEKRALGIFKAFDGMQGLDSVMKKAFGEDLPSIEKAWAKYISYHTTPFKR
jgi:hypothetical protein